VREYPALGYPLFGPPISEGSSITPQKRGEGVYTSLTLLCSEPDTLPTQPDIKDPGPKMGESKKRGKF